MTGVSTDVYQKPTDNPAYLHRKSAHDHRLIKSIPYSQSLRLRRICQNDKTLKKRIQQYSEYFVACDYKRTDIHEEMRRVETISQEEALKPKEKTQVARIPLVVTYNPDLPPVRKIVYKRWKILHEDERLEKVFKNPPVVAFRKPKNLKDLLVRSNLYMKRKRTRDAHHAMTAIALGVDK